MKFGTVRDEEDLLRLIERVGFLPFFKNEIAGFSVEECCPRELWFAKDTDGPWEWKGPAASSGRCMYGKLFRKKAGFVSAEWVPDFVNLRRDGSDFDELYASGAVAHKDKIVYDTVLQHGDILSKELKRICGYRKGGNKGFDTVITRLQMQTYLCISDFEYMRDKYGVEYGWGVARYSTPEELLGVELICSGSAVPPEESAGRVEEHLQKLLPHAPLSMIEKLIRI